MFVIVNWVFGDQRFCCVSQEEKNNASAILKQNNFHCSLTMKLQSAWCLADSYTRWNFFPVLFCNPQVRPVGLTPRLSIQPINKSSGIHLLLLGQSYSNLQWSCKICAEGNPKLSKAVWHISRLITAHYRMLTQYYVIYLDFS